MRTAAIIGCGDVSVVHAEALAALHDIKLVAVCDTDPARLATASSAYSVPGFTDHHQLLAQQHPDVVHVCTPHHTHAEVAVDCLRAGVHVLLEKPVAHTLDEANRLIIEAEASPAQIGVCFQNRYNTAVAAMHRLLTSGELGTVLGAAATVLWHRTSGYYRSRPWRGTWAGSGGGVLMNQAIHTVDLVQWLMGEVTSVSGHASTRALAEVIEVEDTAEFVLEHRSGARSALYATLAHAVDAPVILQVATERAVLDLRGDLTVTHPDGRVDTVTERRGSSGGRAYWGISHQLLIADFYARLDDAQRFWLSPREALASLSIVKEVYRQTYADATHRVA